MPFYRYTYQNFQAGGVRGTDANGPTGAGKREFNTVGAALFPTSTVVLKLTYGNVKGQEPGGARSDYVLGGVGFFF